MAKILNLGIIGMSEGNGHPYSWSAIFNGYNKDVMESCPFPAIPDYLSRQKFPLDGLGHLGKVTHVWTQDKSISEHISAASNIPYVSDNMNDMMGAVDAILLARDDGENHYSMALPFIQAGLPIFIDKPLAITLDDAHRIFDSEVFPNQIFSCSSLRYAAELILSADDRRALGTIHHVECSIMKKWDTYAVHILEPVISQLPERGKLCNVQGMVKNDIRTVLVEWENISGVFTTTANNPVTPEFRFFGSSGSVTKLFSNSFDCFKASLLRFTKLINGTASNIEKNETFEIVDIIEKGRKL